MPGKIGVIFNGLGKMGTAALKGLLYEDNIVLAGAFDPKPTEEAQQLCDKHGFVVAPSIKEYYYLTELVTDRLRPEKLVLVDFSTPAAAREAALYCADRECKIVIGTTPLPKDVEENIRALSEKTAVMIAPNYSPDVNRFMKIMESVGSLSDKDAFVSIYEVHRAEKPTTSGTAIDIAKTFCRTMGKVGYIRLREGKAYDASGSEVAMPEMKPDVLRDYIQISAVRFADEPGTHVVRIGNENDYTEYAVRATRASYAKGLVMAVRTAAKAEKGLLDFKKDILKL